MAGFDHFVLFAEMRTGSNFLEANLNALDGVTCHGEAFNPHFIGYPNRSEILGISREERDRDPFVLLDRIRAERGGRASVIAGFRFFNDHDPRVIDRILADPRCGKIVLTRNPVESYVSRKIAAATGQWKLTNVKHARSDKAVFEAAEFAEHLEGLQAFQLRILRALQSTGQTAFYVDYEDIQSLEVMNGLAAWLGVPARLAALDKKLKKQNPEPLSEKVVNFDEMEAALARLDRFDLGRTPNFEPRRGAMIPNYLALPDHGLLYMPIRSAGDDLIADWLTAANGGRPLAEGFNQKTLRSWKIAHPGYRSFTMVRHPVARAHAAFCDRILPGSGPGTYPEIRQNLRRHFGLPLPEGNIGDDYDTDTHRAAFKAFLAFVKANLAGQTNLRIDGNWATQTALLQSVAGFQSPDAVLREEDLAEALPALARKAGLAAPPAVPSETDRHRPALELIHDAEIEAAARDAYARDYENFGYSDWA